MLGTEKLILVQFAIDARLINLVVRTKVLGACTYWIPPLASMCFQPPRFCSVAGKDPRTSGVGVGMKREKEKAKSVTPSFLQTLSM